MSDLQSKSVECQSCHKDIPRRLAVIVQVRSADEDLVRHHSAYAELCQECAGDVFNDAVRDVFRHALDKVRAITHCESCGQPLPEDREHEHTQAKPKRRKRGRQ